MNSFRVDVEAVLQARGVKAKKFTDKNNYGYQCKVDKTRDGYQILISTFYSKTSSNENGRPYFIQVDKSDKTGMASAAQLLKEITVFTEAAFKRNNNGNASAAAYLTMRELTINTQVTLNGSLRALVHILKDKKQQQTLLKDDFFCWELGLKRKREEDQDIAIPAAASSSSQRIIVNLNRVKPAPTAKQDIEMHEVTAVEKDPASKRRKNLQGNKVEVEEFNAEDLYNQTQTQSKKFG